MYEGYCAALLIVLAIKANPTMMRPKANERLSHNVVQFGIDDHFEVQYNPVPVESIPAVLIPTPLKIAD
jgi:hypothetical protein